MQFLINVIPNNQLSKHNLKLLIENIAYQNNRKIQLVIKDNFLTDEIKNFLLNINTNLKIQLVNNYSDISLNDNDNYYWINLKDNDCLLPNAISQWESVLEHHQSPLVWLSGLKNEYSFHDQMNQFINDANHARRTTIQNLFYSGRPINQLSLKQKLNLALGLQEYNVLNDKDRFTFLKQSQTSNMNINNILFKVDYKFINNLDPTSFDSILHLMLDNQEMINLTMPTLATSQMKGSMLMDWIKQVSIGTKDIGEDRFLNDYYYYFASQIREVLISILSSSLNDKNRQQKLRQINHYNQKLPRLFRIKNFSKITIQKLIHSTNQLLSKKE